MPVKIAWHVPVSVLYPIVPVPGTMPVLLASTYRHRRETAAVYTVTARIGGGARPRVRAFVCTVLSRVFPSTTGKKYCHCKGAFIRECTPGVAGCQGTRVPGYPGAQPDCIGFARVGTWVPNHTPGVPGHETWLY